MTMREAAMTDSTDHSAIVLALRLAGHQIADTDAAAIADHERWLNTHLMMIESATSTLIDAMTDTSRAVAVASDIVLGHSPAWSAITTYLQQSLVTALRLSAAIDTAIITTLETHP